MSKAQEIREAVEQAKRETWQCRSCSSEAQENSPYCMYCEMYWDDVDNGAFDDGPRIIDHRNNPLSDILSDALKRYT